MREAGRCSGYMPLSGTASGRPLMINSVSRRGHRQIILATFPRPKTAFPQLKSPFKATRRRNLSLACADARAPHRQALVPLARVPHYAWLLPQALARTLARRSCGPGRGPGVAGTSLSPSLTAMNGKAAAAGPFAAPPPCWKT